LICSKGDVRNAKKKNVDRGRGQPNRKKTMRPSSTQRKGKKKKKEECVSARKKTNRNHERKEGKLHHIAKRVQEKKRVHNRRENQ